MNTNAIVVGFIILVLGGVGFFLLSGQGADDAMMEQEEVMAEENGDAVMDESDPMMRDDGVMMEEGDGGAMMETGTYEAYAPEKLARAAEGDVVLFFKADWCPTCRALEADIQANAASIPANLSILTLNYDTETALKQKYGVTYQHTLVQVDSSGDAKGKWTGTMTLAALLSEIE